MKSSSRCLTLAADEVNKAFVLLYLSTIPLLILLCGINYCYYYNNFKIKSYLFLCCITFLICATFKLNLPLKIHQLLLEARIRVNHRPFSAHIGHGFQHGFVLRGHEVGYDYWCWSWHSCETMCILRKENVNTNERRQCLQIKQLYWWNLHKMGNGASSFPMACPAHSPLCTWISETIS